MVAGVASAVSRALGIPLTLVRAGFVVLTFVHLVGVVAYVLLWLIIPRDPGEPSLLEDLLGRAQTLARRLSGRDEHGSLERRTHCVSDSPAIELKRRGAKR